MKYYCLIAFLLSLNLAFSQNVKQEKMALLSFMEGEWIGTTMAYEDGVISKKGSAYQRIAFDLDKHILVIELNSEFLQLHTIIYYDDTDDTYYYNPFYKSGAAKYPAKYVDGQLIVNSSESRRFVFSRIEDGGFREYGEQLLDGQWTKYFEDIFTNSK